MQRIIGVTPPSPDQAFLVQDPTAAAAMRFHAAAAMQAQSMHGHPAAAVGGAPTMQAYPVHLPLAMADPRMMAMTPPGGVNAVIFAPMGMNGMGMPGMLPAGFMPHPIPSHQIMQAPMRPFPHAPSRNRLVLGRGNLRPGVMRPKMVPSADMYPSMAPSNPELEMYLRNMERAELSFKANRFSPTMLRMKRIPVEESSGVRVTPSNRGVGKDIALPDKDIVAAAVETVAASAKQSKKAGTDKVRKPRAEQKDKPKRPLSAYNCFFKEERARILGSIPDFSSSDDGKGKRRRAQHGKISFEELGKTIGQRWQSLSTDEAMVYKMKAAEDMKRYRNQMAEFLAKQNNNKDIAAGSNASDSHDDYDDTVTAPPTEVVVVVSPDSTDAAVVAQENSVAEVSDQDDMMIPTRTCDENESLGDEGVERYDDNNDMDEPGEPDTKRVKLLI